MATAGKGLPFIGKMNEFLDRMLHPTVQKVGFSRAAVDVVHRGYYSLNPVPTTPFTVEAGSTDSVLVLTAHGFKAGDLIRLDVTANSINEFEIVVDEVVDVNTVKLAGYLSASLTAGDTFFALRPIAERFDETGATLAVVASPPISYNRKAAGTTAQTSVLEDLDTPTNSRALPVVIHSIDGAPIVVNAGDLSVSTSHVNDSMAIGDGTNLVAVTASNELQTSDALALAELQSINTNTNGLETLIGTSNTSLSSIDTKLSSQATALKQDAILAELQLKADLTETQPVSMASAPVGASLEATQLLVKAKTDNLDVLLSTRNAEATQALIKAKTDNLDVALSTVAKDATLLASNTLIGAVTETAPASDTASSGLNGRLQRIAQNITTLIGKLPASLGITTAANSLSVAPASDAIFNVKPKALTSSFAENLSLSTVATFTAPANAIGGLIMADDTNTANVRFKQGATATASSGLQLQPGRAEPVGSGTDVSICAESGTQKVMIIWDIQA